MPRGRGWHGESGRHAQAARGICTVKKPVSRVNVEDFPMPGFPGDDLKDHLLSIGGKRVIMFSGDTDPEEILARGELLDGRNAKFIQGDTHQCHSNAAYLFELFPDTTRIMTGYALSDDSKGGQWNEHSWAYDIKDHYIIETTLMRDKYFGYLMTRRESEKFAKENPPTAEEFEYYEGAEMRWRLERMKGGRSVLDRPKVLG